ncbi:PAS domain S-box protein [Bradyrhizobium sp. C-145]|uniref:Blue-light-activated histidine kinase n=1 Tax=Bradyrhizobium zhanjiangense TaxID=1325107 RepID=A0ABY0DL36_9BRAD|nr:MULTISPECIES: PAS domain S-box protein [Bradyrhizobium]RXG94975.1 PAS domain S-box protein [Bradyrhizobium zhanjiangense]UQR64588.1 PAS domain S-box protein [Bradyrhizobium sp. C-145]
MPFTASQREAGIVRVLRRLHHEPTAAYGASIMAVGVATLARVALEGHVVAGVAFITFYPAIILATFLCGLGPGLLAIVLSAVAAWSLFLPPDHAITGTAAVSLVVFLVVSGFMVALIVFLNDALERVLAREEEVRTLIEASPNGVIVVDDQGKIRLLNASAEKLFGYQRNELLGQSVEVLVPDRLASAHKALRSVYMKTPEARPMGANLDLNARRKDGTEVPVEVGLSPLRRDGKRVVIASLADLSERKKAAEEQRVLMSEMRHRTQNLFSVISAIVRNSLSANRPTTEVRDLLLSRLQSLARAHSMLADAAWQGAPLNEIVRRELKPFTDRAEIKGCDIAVGSSAAQNFALIVHELATNATKHGALSVPGGRVAIEGKIERSDLEEDVFSFRWRESGGPPVAMPARHGFGSTVLLEVAKGLGKPALDYKPEGLSYELLVSLSAIRGTTPASQADPSCPEDRM